MLHIISRTTAGILALLFFTAIALPAMAQPQGGTGRPGGPQWGGPWTPGPQAPVRQANYRHRGGKGDREHGCRFLFKALQMPHVRQRLGITDDQTRKIEDLHYNTEKQAIELDARVKTAKLDMKHLLHENRPERNRVMAQVDAVAKAKTDRAKLDVSAGLDLREILTDQQLDTIKRFMKEQAGRHWGRQWGDRGQGGPGYHRGRDDRGPDGPWFDRMRKMREQRWQQRGGQGPAAGQGPAGTPGTPSPAPPPQP